MPFLEVNEVNNENKITAELLLVLPFMLYSGEQECCRVEEANIFSHL